MNTYTLTQRLREDIDPSVYIQTLKTIMMGSVPLWVDDARVEGGIKVIPDPNPLMSSPTLEQRMSAMREMVNRQEGLAVQSIQLDAQFKAQLNDGLPAHMLEKPNYRILQQIADILKKEKERDIVDAELVEPLALQESSQVETPTNLELKDLGQDPNKIPSDLAQVVIDTVLETASKHPDLVDNNLVLGDDKS
jgi:hypothetical protein